MVELSGSIKEKAKKTFQYQDKLPKLPIPPLGDTLQRYLSVIKPLQVRYIKIIYNKAQLLMISLICLKNKK